jgi:branched-chain amino acid transport system ATP-binding protein
VSNVSCVVEEGAITAIIGPNGAGKTTFFNCITAVAPPTSGEILFDGRRIDGMKPHQVTRLGMARTFQNIRLFREMTALDNVVTARHCRTRSGVVASLLRLKSMRLEESESRETADSLLDFVGLSAWRDVAAGSLPYGDQRRLEIARALATEPRLLLLDEPAAGMNPRESQDLVALIRRISDKGITVVLIEHHMKVVMGISTHVIVLDHGEKIADCTPESCCKNPAVIAAYLGKETVE